MRNSKNINDGDLMNWWDRINIRLDKMLACLLTLMILTQLVSLNQSARTFLSRTDKLEGKSVEDSQLLVKKGEIEFTIENYESTRYLDFYINGEKATVKGDKTVRLPAKDNDIIEVCGSDFDDMAILRITSVSENIAVPEPGKVVYVNKNLVLVDRVRLK